MNGRIERKFLDWRRPALAAAGAYLRERFGSSGTLDLGQVIVVVPGGRAGRRLLEILVGEAEAHNLVLTPPEIVTPERFPEKLYEAQWPFASVLTQRLAWAQALRAAKAKTLAAVLPHPPPPGDTHRWLAIGETLRRMHLELAADGLDCGKVLEGAQGVEGFAEHERWKALCELQQGYLRVLDELKLWDVQTARLVAIRKREIQTERQVILLGTADLNRAQRQMLDQISDRVTALVVAEPELAERFDEHGCLVPERWAEIELPLADEQIEPVDGPADQAAAVERWLASLGGAYRADQLAIGLPDEKLAPHIERQLTQCGLAARRAVGKRLAETGPYRLLDIAVRYAARNRFRDLAALVRHPDVFDWLAGALENEGLRVDVLGGLDAFAQDHCPLALEAQRLENDERGFDVAAIHRQVEALIAGLRGEKRPLADWVQPLRGVLVAVYGRRLLNRAHEADRYLAEALEAVSAAIDDLATVPAALQPLADSDEACQIVLNELAGQGIAPTANAGAIELLGWLDLPLDDACATVVTSLNEGLVPSSVTADAFLPNRLRQSLGLLHNDRRLARDAYALSVLCASRRELRVIVGRRDSEGNPLAPSRLLFLTSPDKMVARGQWLFGPPPPQPPRRNLLVPPKGPAARTQLEPPRPTKLKEPIRELSVTRFRDYIACPYRFYLRHQLQLRQVADDAAELDGGAFGNMLHWVLEQFGRAAEAKAVRESAAAGRIADYLDEKLDQIAAARYGKRQARPAVLVQIEQARLRLRAFAQWQAGRTAEGWRIVFSEDSERRDSLNVDFPVDDEPFRLIGRIDRVDYHDKLRRLAVLDYKTADRGDDPRRTHRCRDEWIDLQLPLYRKLVRAAPLEALAADEAAIDLGYILLPVDLKGVGLKLADWDGDLLRSADEKAAEIIRCLRREVFWPPTYPPPDFADDVAAICQDRRMGAAAYGGEAA